MPAFLVVFGTWIVERIGKYLLSLGVFGVAYLGADLLVDKVVGNIVRSIGGGLGDAYNILMLAGFGQAINIILSACAFSLALSAKKGAVE